MARSRLPRFHRARPSTALDERFVLARVYQMRDRRQVGEPTAVMTEAAYDLLVDGVPSMGTACSNRFETRTPCRGAFGMPPR